MDGWMSLKYKLCTSNQSTLNRVMTSTVDRRGIDEEVEEVGLTIY